MNTQFSIYRHQLGSFKRHAVELGKAINALNHSYLVQGSKRVNYLAEACGYKNHTDLINHAASVSDQKVLGLFAPGMAPQLAKLYAEISGFPYEYVLAGMINAVEVLYVDETHEQFDWSARDIEHLSDEVSYLLYPDMKKTMQSIRGVENSAKMLKNIFESSPVFQLSEVMRKQQPMFDLIEKSRLASEAWSNRIPQSALQHPIFDVVAKSQAAADVLRKNTMPSTEFLKAVEMSSSIFKSTKFIETSDFINNSVMKAALKLDSLRLFT